MNKDIVERLRAGFQCAENGDRCRTMDAQSGCVCAEAADEIERLRAALRDIITDSYSVYAIQVARAALGGE